MKCLYYLTGILDSTRQISEDLHQNGIDDWFVHVLSKDETNLRKYKIHSSNYLETLDTLRYGLIGLLVGALIGVALAVLFSWTKPFGSDMPNLVYYAIVGFFSLFGIWEGGLTGIALENKKISLFHNDLASGEYLILIYAKTSFEEQIKDLMATLHPEAQLVAVDANFYNPLASLQRL